MRYKAVPFAEGEQMRKAFLAKRCDIMFHDVSAIASFKATLGAQAGDYVLLPRPTAASRSRGAVRKGDDRWFDIVRYTLERHGRSRGARHHFQERQDLRRARADPAVKRLLGVEGDLGPSMGLDKDWAVNVIAQVGNYGEMWERAFAASGMPRGANRLAAEGGLLYAFPMQ